MSRSFRYITQLQPQKPQEIDKRDYCKLSIIAQYVNDGSFWPVLCIRLLPTEKMNDEFQQILHQISPFTYRQYENTLELDYQQIYDSFFDSIVFQQWLAGRPWRLRCHAPSRSGKTTFTAAIVKAIQEYNDEDDDNTEVDDEDDDLEETDNTEQHVEVEDHADEDEVDDHTSEDEISDAHNIMEDSVDDHETSNTKDTNKHRDDMRIGVSIYLDLKDPTGSFDLLSQSDTSVEEAIARSILRQLIERKHETDQDCYTIERIQQLSTDIADLSTSTIERLIAIEAGNTNGIFVVIDGLADDSVLTKLHDHLKSMTSIQFSVMSIENSALFPDLVSSNCDNPECEYAQDIGVYWKCKQCPPDTSLDYCANCYPEAICSNDESHEFAEPYVFRVIPLATNEDALSQMIENVLQREVDAKTNLGKQIRSTIDETTQLILQKAQDSFVLAKLYLESIIESQSLESLVGAFSRLPQFEVEYFHAMMEHIQSDQRELALVLLQLIMSAAQHDRSMSVQELTGAAQHYFRSTTGKDIEITKENIGIITNGFLIVETTLQEEVQHVTPFHPDVLTFLNEECEDWFSNTHLDMALLCLTRIKQFLDRHSATDLLPRKILDDFFTDPFLIYTWQYWGEHLASEPSIEAEKNALSLLHFLDDLPSSIRNAAYLMRISAPPDDRRPFRRPYGKAMHVLAHFSLGRLATTYLDELNYNPRVIDEIDAVTGMTPLMVAVERKHVDFVAMLLANGANADLHDYYDHCPLSLAIERLFIETTSEDKAVINRIIGLLLENLSDSAVNAHVMNNQTLLMLAVERKLDYVIDSLLKHSCLDLNVQDSRGRNLVHIAIDNADMTFLNTAATTHKEKFKQLVNKSDRSGRLPLTALLQNFSISHSEKVSALDLLSKFEADFEAVDDSGQSALHHAINNSENSPEIITHILGRGVSIDSLDSEGRTPLHIASASDCKPHVEVLLSNGADQARRDSNGFTPFDMAQVRRSSTVMDLFSSPQEEKEEMDFTTLPLWQQVFTDPVQFVRLHTLPETPPAEVSLDPLGQTPLHLAVIAGNRDAISLLLQDDRIDVNAKNIYGDTALHRAGKLWVQGQKSRIYSNAIEELFLTNPRIDQNIRDAAGLTLLDFALEGRRTLERTSAKERRAWELALLLVSHGADLALPKYQLQLLYREAIIKERSDILGRLIKAGANPLLSQLPFCAVQDAAQDKDCVQLAYSFGDEALLASHRSI